jgi:transcriptional antiterminator
MEYEILKVYNNNVVLAKQNNEEVVLLSKGIGFGKRQGQKILENDSIEKVFYNSQLESEDLNLTQIKKRKKEIEGVIKQIINIAETRMGKLNENTEKALTEHIDFAIERLNMGLIIENPFINEIISLYPCEYEIAELIENLIEEHLGIKIGEEEKGFITLHLYSAKANKSIKETMKITRVYKECIAIIENEYKCTVDLTSSASKMFLRALKGFIQVAGSEKKLHMPIKKYVSVMMRDTYWVAEKISKLIEKENGLHFSADIVSYLAIEIEKLKQLS